METKKKIYYKGDKDTSTKEQKNKINDKIFQDIKKVPSIET